MMFGENVTCCSYVHINCGHYCHTPVHFKRQCGMSLKQTKTVSINSYFCLYLRNLEVNQHQLCILLIYFGNCDNLGHILATKIIKV